MSFIINYEDVCIQETRKASIIKDKAEDCYVKIGLYQTGNMYLMDITKATTRTKTRSRKYTPARRKESDLRAS